MILFKQKLDIINLLLIEQLKELLEATTRVKQLERKEQEAELTQKTYYKVPYPIYIG